MKKILIVPVMMISLAITVSQTHAWVEPDQLPPNGNIAAPLNSGSFAQSKIGGLILGLGNTLYGLIVKNGNSGFGTETPTEKVDVNGNIKLNGRIIGLQAPTDTNDAVNKGYVDALGGGTTVITAWGITECPSPWTTFYSGYAMSGVVYYANNPNFNLSDTLCTKGEAPSVADLGNYSNGISWNWGWNRSKSEPIPCAVCVK